MSRTFQDAGFLTWEVYASSGAAGYPERARIVFACLSDRSLRPRVVIQGGDKADAEKAVLEYSESELRDLLAKTEPLK